MIKLSKIMIEYCSIWLKQQETCEHTWRRFEKSEEIEGCVTYWAWHDPDERWMREWTNDDEIWFVNDTDPDVFDKLDSSIVQLLIINDVPALWKIGLPSFPMMQHSLRRKDPWEYIKPSDEPIGCLLKRIFENSTLNWALFWKKKHLSIVALLPDIEECFIMKIAELVAQ